MSTKSLPRNINISGNQSLMKRMQRGDLDAHDECFRKYNPYLSTQYLPRQFPTLSQEEINDIVSETTLRIFNKCKQCKNESDLSVHNWITKICTRFVYSYFRKKKRRKEYPLDKYYDDYLPGDGFDENNILDLLYIERIVPNAGLTRLEAFVLSRWLREIPGIETAKKLGVSPARVSQIKSKALDKLKVAAGESK